MKKRKSHLKRMIVIPVILMLCAAQLPVLAEQDYNFETSYSIEAEANGYFIAKDAAGKYGLLDEEGNDVSEDGTFQYDEMEFLEDSMQYPFVKVKKNDAYGILDYEGKEVIEVSYDSIDAFSNDNTVAAAYNGADTELFDTDGKSMDTKLSGEYTVISDNVFLSQDQDKKEQDKKEQIVSSGGTQLLDLKEEQMIDENGDACAVKVGEYYAVQKYLLDEPKNIGEYLKADQYVAICKDKNIEYEVEPKGEWGDEDDKVRITGSLQLIRALSDTSILLKMDYDDENKDFYVIYDMDEKEFSSKYKTVGEFTDGKAFAEEYNEDNDKEDENKIFIIDTKGEKDEKTDTVKLPDGYEAETTILEESTETALLKLKKDKEETYKLYGLDGKELEGTWKGVYFLGNNYTRVKNNDGDYGIINAKGEEIVACGKFNEDLMKEKNILRSDTGVTIKEKSGDKTRVYYYQTAEKQEEGFFQKYRLQILIGAAAVVVLAIILIVLMIVRRKRKKTEEEVQKTPVRKLPPKPNIPPQPPVPELKPDSPVKPSKPERDPKERRGSRPENTAGMPGAGSHKKAAGGYIVGVEGEYKGKILQIKAGGQLRLGRSSDCDIVLQNPKASRHHCIIRYNAGNGKYLVTDYSSNGVYLSNGKRFPQKKTVELDAGTVLLIANDQTVFELGKNR